MSQPPDSRPAAPYWSADGIALGARQSVPAIPVMALFAIAFGAFAAQKGLTFAEATLMSALNFAGAAQFVVAEIWTRPMTGAVIIAIALVTGIINMRFVLIGASLRPWLGGLPARQAYPALAVLTEPGWLIALRYRDEGGRDAATLLGSGLVLWLVWIAATAGGYLIGATVSDPQRYGLDLVMPVFFMVILVPLWRGARAAVPWAVAGAVAVAAAQYLPGSWYLIAGAVAGAIAGGMQDER
jgi:4-azaleucine resistance transporter AzlC